MAKNRGAILHHFGCNWDSAYCEIRAPISIGAGAFAPYCRIPDWMGDTAESVEGYSLNCRGTYRLLRGALDKANIYTREMLH